MITYRRAAASDAPVIDRLLRDLATHDGGEIKGSVDSLLRHGFGAAPLFRAVLAEEDGAPIGLCLFFPEYSSWRGKVGVFVQDLYVATDRRGEGIGTALLSAAVAEAADWDPAFITLMVHDSNAKARDFYAAQGFILREKADLLVMEGGAFRRLMS